MGTFHTTNQPSCPSYLDDCITALTLQLEEITYHNETSNKGKYPADKVPDHNVACASYLSEIRDHLQLLEDTKFAHSIANAVYTDAELITQMAQQEAQAQDDRIYARQISTDHPLEYEAPPPYTEKLRQDFIDDEITSRLAAMLTADDSLHEDTTSEADPSVSSTQCQAKALGHLSREQFECCACRGDFRLASVKKLECGHLYCSNCIKRVVMRATVEHDLVYIPPRCCGTPITRSLIVSSLTAEELEEFELTEKEKDTREKTYCANSDCRRFVAPVHIKSSEATCPRCKHKTCSACKNNYHEDDCPVDLDLRATLDLGQTKRWQRCFSCQALVEIDWGCNHMTCRCGAQFCYQCGIEWRGCRCALWEEQNLYRRAEQVVDRAAGGYIPPHLRQQRLNEVQEELRDNDECNHYGRKKFSMITEGAPRRGFRCEMCNARHRNFILRCKSCQLDVCAECRRNRV
ncbi:hypothetical protein J3E72DRAFT_219130 [Bipolaris maydis]|nr:hypothetical protein J3E72DRAFT_219130 [Bipolaris maydis]KAJ6282167.1 hypothetical protein J3E71DRAFT_398683 [Bipolaris maydis]